jgi:hypothetical protein
MACSAGEVGHTMHFNVWCQCVRVRLIINVVSSSYSKTVTPGSPAVAAAPFKFRIPAAAAWVRLGRMPTGSESMPWTPGLGEPRFCHNNASSAAGNPIQTCRTSDPPGPDSVASGPLPCRGGETKTTYIRTLRFRSALTASSMPPVTREPATRCEPL